MNDLDNIDLTIHRLIGAWAIKCRPLITPAAMEELERVVLRPVFLRAAALTQLVEAADSGEWHSSDDCFVEGRSLDCRLCRAIAAARSVLPDAGAVGE